MGQAVLFFALVFALAGFSCMEMKHRTGPHTRRPTTAGYDVAVHHPNRYPLYMMQLYRDYRSVEAGKSSTAKETRPALHQSDSVLSLIAKGRRIKLIN